MPSRAIERGKEKFRWEKHINWNMKKSVVFVRKMKHCGTDKMGNFEVAKTHMELTQCKLNNVICGVQGMQYNIWV